MKLSSVMSLTQWMRRGVSPWCWEYSDVGAEKRRRRTGGGLWLVPGLGTGHCVDSHPCVQYSTGQSVYTSQPAQCYSYTSSCGQLTSLRRETEGTTSTCLIIIRLPAFLSPLLSSHGRVSQGDRCSPSVDVQDVKDRSERCLVFPLGDYYAMIMISSWHLPLCDVPPPQ